MGFLLEDFYNIQKLRILWIISNYFSGSDLTVIITQEKPSRNSTDKKQTIYRQFKCNPSSL